MTPQYILRKSLCRPAHCFSAHVPGKGYVNRGELETDRPEYDKQRRHAAESEIENLGWANGYAEPGYQDPERGVLFANWNVFPRGVDDILERAGYAIEWSDEWSTCSDCGKAFRTSADSYGWQPSYVILNECELVCRDCVDWSEYLEDLEDDPTRAVQRDCDPADYGYTRVSEPREYENGFHPGQSDDPAAILAALHAEGKTRIVFRVADVGQFDVHFETWQRIGDDE